MNFFDKEKTKRPKAIMQVFLYSHLYLLNNPGSIIEPNIYYLRNLYSSTFETTIVQKENKNKSKISDFAEIKDTFKTKLDECIDEIFDFNVPFTQTTTNEACKWCAFTNICKK